MADSKLWLDEQIGQISGKSRLAEATRFALSRWEGLTLFLDDGRVETDNNMTCSPSSCHGWAFPAGHSNLGAPEAGR